MSEPLISIVMPVYNAAKFLRRSIGSILAQSFDDFELIVVDDRSTDGSLEICRELEKTDRRIKIIALEKNSGASAARNAALDRLGGRYVTFVDADDWIESDVLDRAAGVLRADGSIDCLKYGCSEDYFDGDRLSYQKICRVDDETLDDREAIEKKIVELETIPLFGYIWNGIYRAALIKKFSIRFDESRRVNEDFFFNAEFFRRVKVLRTLDCSGYHYEKRGGGSLSSTARNYSYEVNRQKIAALIGLFEGGVPSESEGKIFWMYVRFCYAALVGGEDFSVIRSDPLFDRLRAVAFDDATLKRRILIGLLRNEMMSPLLTTAVGLIRLIKGAAPTLFARLKR